MKNTSLFILTLSLLTMMISCGESGVPKKEIISPIHEPNLAIEDTIEINEGLKAQPKVQLSDTSSPIHKMKLKFAKGTWEYEILNFIESDELKRSFVMDKVPFEGEELPAEASIQLDNLAAIYTTFPFLKIEVQAHTSAAKNDVGKKTKKIASKTLAMWVSAKLNMRGVPNNMLSSTGMGDEELIKDIDPEDKGQKRIVAVLTKDRAF